MESTSIALLKVPLYLMQFLLWMKTAYPNTERFWVIRLRSGCCHFQCNLKYTTQLIVIHQGKIRHALLVAIVIIYMVNAENGRI